MDQPSARRIAKERGGIATQAKPSKSKNGGWHLGGWATKDSTWVVVLPPDGKIISKDGSGDA